MDPLIIFGMLCILGVAVYLYTSQKQKAKADEDDPEYSGMDALAKDLDRTSIVLEGLRTWRREWLAEFDELRKSLKSEQFN